MLAVVRKVALVVLAIVLPLALVSGYLFAWQWPPKEHRVQADYVAFVGSVAVGAACFGWILRSSKNRLAWMTCYAIAISLLVLIFAIYIISRVHGKWYEAQYPSWP